MNVYVSTLAIEGTELEGDNPLPMFRNRNPQREVTEDGSFPPELKLNFGANTGERFLPYRVQDRYTRERRTIHLKTITLENELLKAVFLPDYGGRLYSLKDKRKDKEILYRNPVMQPANLAILNAWFSGGIEWNIGQVGHTFGTCSPLHAAKLIDDDGNAFVRMYEYERCKNVFWQMDFHLPSGAEQLQVYVRIVNDNDQAVPMYWWTNIAVEETERARVFSASSEAIYIVPGLNGHGVGHLPELPSLPGRDASYPMNFPFSSEYFFQTHASCQSPWEAVAYEDGRLFYERSTSLLRYRKMFCWGHHAGGRRWCDFLAKPGEGNYIEVQGGLAPTQLHGIEMPPRTTWEFTQAFGMTDIDEESVFKPEWADANSDVARRLESILSADDVYAIHDKLRAFAEREPGERLHDGSGWGALERVRRETTEGRPVPSGLTFEDRTLGAAQAPWLALLREGRLPEHAVEEAPPSWMIQEAWAEKVRASLGQPEGRTWTAYLHAGVMAYESGMEQAAIEAWEASLRLRPSAWAYRNLAEAAKRNGETDKALRLLEQAYGVSGRFPDRALAEEYLQLLIQDRRYEEAWRLYETLPANYANADRIKIIVGAAALELGQEAFMKELFDTEFAVIREGEVLIIELWYKYHAKKLAESRNEPLSQAHIEEAKIQFPPPSRIDFRMIGS
ncbi:DUF5107 domain-containing protein [Cohnella soli]|uniref:DUF5107 domain-containing protein n=1 Tax=Cohnella soli TaxID=425005 RepID=A0ABW0I3I7_9BACL